MMHGLEVALVVGYMLSLPIAWLATVYGDARYGTQLSPSPVWVVWPAVPIFLVAVFLFSLFCELRKRMHALGMQHRDRAAIRRGEP